MYRALPDVATQGSIITPVYFSAIDENMPAVILTPTCDIEQDKWSYLTCIALHRFPGTIGGQILRGQWSDLAYEVKEGDKVPRTSLTPKQLGRLKEKVNELMKNRLPRFHWFDPWEQDGEAYIADFQLVTSMARTELPTVQQAAYLESEHLESLPSRYVSYMGRIGTLDKPEGSETPFAQLLIRSEFPDTQAPTVTI